MAVAESSINGLVNFHTKLLTSCYAHCSIHAKVCAVYSAKVTVLSVLT